MTVVSDRNAGTPGEAAEEDDRLVVRALSFYFYDLKVRVIPIYLSTPARIERAVRLSSTCSMQSLEKKQSKQMVYHNGITAGTHLSCAAKSGGWRTKLSRTAVRTMGQARGNNHACAGLPFGRGCGCRPQTRAGKQPTPWCRCLTDWPRICVGLFGMILGG